MPNIEITKEVFPDTSWHEIGAVGEPAFTNSWVNYDGSTWGTAAYRIDSEGWVHLKGLIRSGTLSTTAFTLPTGFRPGKRSHYFPVVCANVGGFIQVNPDGTVQPGSGAGSNSFISLEGVRFPSWQTWSEYKDKYFPFTALTIRNAAEFHAGYWPRLTGMVECMGITESTPPGTAGDMNAAPPYLYSTLFGATDATATPKQHQLSNRYGIFAISSPTSYGIFNCEYSTVGIEDNWIAPSLSNSWVNYGVDTSNTYGIAGYWKDSMGFVHIRGMVRSGSSATATMFTLPSGYRPTLNAIFQTQSAAASNACRIDVESNGIVYANSGGSTSWTSIDGICFYAG